MSLNLKRFANVLKKIFGKNTTEVKNFAPCPVLADTKRISKATNQKTVVERKVEQFIQKLTDLKKQFSPFPLHS